jgi:monoamine oxidase
MEIRARVIATGCTLPLREIQATAEIQGERLTGLAREPPRSGRGYMDGAVRSGEQVAKTVLAELA